MEFLQVPALKKCNTRELVSVDESHK